RRIHEHLRVRTQRRLLTEVQRSRPAIRETDHHEAAAADVAGGRMHDGECETRRNRRIDRIAAVAQNVGTHFARDAVRGHDQPLAYTYLPPRKSGFRRLY